MAVIAVLVMVSAGVIARQFKINPAVVALRPESHQQTLASGVNDDMLIDTADSDVAPLSAAEKFDPDTLYEKINGRADLYLASGFVSLNTQRFAMNASAGSWVEVFIYDMATPANAFSVFSMQRREDARTDTVVPSAYRTENALFMTHGRFYVEMIGTDSSENLHQAMGVLAGRFIDAHGGTARVNVPGADLFPKDGLEPDSLQLIGANAFGYEQLDQIYTAEYLIDGERLTAFVSERPNAEAASELVVDYRQTLLAFGAAAVESPWNVNDMVILQFFDTYEIIFNQGHYLAGIHEAGSLKAAEILVRRLSEHLMAIDGR